LIVVFIGILDEEEGEDNETEREMSLLLLEQNALSALDAQLVLNEEITILDHMAQLMLQNNGKLPELPRPAPVCFYFPECHQSLSFFRIFITHIFFRTSFPE
jgi:hypothetical protein